MAVLYVWNPNGDSWGLASLFLEDSQVCISWWPNDYKSKYGKKKNKVDAGAALPEEYNEDVEFNLRECNHRCNISQRKINPGPIIEWWRKTKRNSGYHFLAWNCCTVVHSALEISGCFEWRHPGMKFISEPRQMKRYGESLEKATGKDGNPCVIR